eukprot:CAMPEP_0197617512 /NCGR_PEP_ID=MMETSP1326-20131121/61074_1 /TAXON_ID=1155430 /ORGANISM="Genus nov. species nov., Strain RCC2288" /LENGTH=453 /DNA_ID=CAMNT_0043186407 /DNA_START=228 /DNA_END=1589 /DNA_ORIENTATION=-
MSSLSRKNSYANYQTAGPPTTLAQLTAKCYQRKSCRLCDGGDLCGVLKLTPTPPANAFVPKDRLSHQEETFPLQVNFCGGCAHLQLSHVIDPEYLFSNYVYVSGTSPVMVQHLKDYALEAVALCGVQAGAFVFEFGSNDGTLLRHFKELGMKVLGMDPAKNLADKASADGLPTIADFFGSATAKDVRATHGAAGLICANHCCAHIDDFRGVVEGVKELLAPNGVWIFEVGYLLHVFKSALFDTIYHEHVDFHSLQPIKTFCDNNGLKLLNASSNSIQGGSLRCYVGWPDSSPEVKGGAEGIMELVREEIAIGLHKEETFLRWANSINNTGEEVFALLSGLKQVGKTVAAYGAPAKATTLMYHFGLTADLIEYIVDDNPLKQGLYSPGLHIPVIEPTHIYEVKPDYILILAWNFAESIMRKHESFLLAGGAFIVPLPQLRIVKQLPKDSFVSGF